MIYLLKIGIKVAWEMSTQNPSTYSNVLYDVYIVCTMYRLYHEVGSLCDLHTKGQRSKAV